MKSNMIQLIFAPLFIFQFPQFALAENQSPSPVEQPQDQPEKQIPLAARKIEAAEHFHADQNNCKKCHFVNKADSLLMLTGDKTTRENTPELCGQCHGIIKRNWDAGTHGKKINSWTKTGTKLICIECHKPHNPKFPKFKAKPPMQRSKFAIPKGHDHE